MKIFCSCFFIPAVIIFFLVTPIEGFSNRVQVTSEQAHVSGKVFYDVNGNSIFDDGDSVIVKGEMSAYNNATTIKTVVKTNELGDYEFNLEAGYYIISLISDFDNSEYVPATLINQYFGEGISESFNFILKALPGRPVHVTGRVFYDNNQDNIFNGNDSAARNASVNFFIPGTYLHEQAITNSTGHYFLRKDIGTYKLIVSPGSFNMADYDTPYSVVRVYHLPGNDMVDFAIPKKDSVTYIFNNFNTDDHSPVPNTGGSKAFNIHFGYSGALLSMPVSLKLDYNPGINIFPSVPPTASSPGHLQWDIESLPVNEERKIMLTINFPVVGDTIDAFFLNYQMVPGLVISNVPPSLAVDYSQEVFHQNVVKGESKSLDWLRTFSGIADGSSDDAGGIDTAAKGEFYFASAYKSSVPVHGMMVAKINSDGLSIWERYLSELVPGIIPYQSPVVKHTRDGGCVIIGNGLNSQNMGRNIDILVARFDAGGNLLWHKILGGTNDDGGGFENDIVEVNDGFLLTGTTLSRDGDFHFSHMDELYSNVFVAKLTSGGELVWQKQYGGSGNDRAFKIIPVQTGFLILSTTESADGDVIESNPGQPGLEDVFAEKAWVLKIDDNGEVIWNKCYGGTNMSFISGAVETNNGFLFCGTTNSKNGDLTEYPENHIPLWLLNVSSVGEISWQKTYKLYKGYHKGDYVESYLENKKPAGIHKTRDGNFITALSVKDKYGTIRSEHGGRDIVIVKLNSSGTILSQQVIGGGLYDEVNNIIPGPKGNLLFAGKTNSMDGDLYATVYPNNSLALVGKTRLVNAVSGKVFIDINGNHFQDLDEPLFNDGNVATYKQGDTTHSQLFGGNFLNAVDTGSYITSYMPVNDYYFTLPQEPAITFNSLGQEKVVDFALVRKPGIRDLQVSITPTSPSRPGNASSFRIIAKNAGTEKVLNAVIKIKKPATFTYTNSSRNIVSVEPDSITFEPIDLDAGITDTLDVSGELAMQPALNNGDTLTYIVIANPIFGDTAIGNNTASFRQFVNGSYNANEKTEAHAGLYTPSMKTSAEPFQYTVYFQNTATDSAFHVTIKDTLDTRVDIKSIRMVTSSHPYKLTIDKNIATWQFENLKLPPSNSNEAGSKGFVSFSLKPSEKLKIGDSIYNRAAIYFDFNLPVITNQSLLAYISQNSVICPGGSTQLQAGQIGIAYKWQINTGNGFTDLASGGIYSGITSLTLQIANAPSSLYGTLYRCLITLNGGSIIYGDIYKLTFTNTWTGANSNAWETASNWSCGSVPDANTDVVIKSNAARQPEVNIVNATCRSINATKSSHVWIKAGAKLNVVGK